MKRTLIMAALCGVTPSYAQQLSLDVMYGRDNDRNVEHSVYVEGWRYAPSTTDNNIMSWYTTSDIHQQAASDGTIQLQFMSADPTAAVSLLSRIDMSHTAIKMQVFAEDWAKVEQFDIIFGSDGIIASHTITLDVKTKLINPPSNEWIEIIVPVSDLERYNQIDLNNVNFVMIKAKGTPGSYVKINEISLLSTAYDQSYVTVSLDDGHETIPAALAIASEYGIKGSLFIDPTVLGQDGFVGMDTIRAASLLGWDVGGHVMQNLTYMQPHEATDRINYISNLLKTHEFRGVDMFAWPNGAHTQRIDTSAYSALFNIDGFSNPSSGFNKHRINRRSVDRWTTLDMIQVWINQAAENNEWLIINFHSFGVDTDESVSVEFFETVCAMIQLSEVDAQPASVVLEQQHNTVKEVIILSPHLDVKNNNVLNVADTVYMVNYGARVGHGVVTKDVVAGDPDLAVNYTSAEVLLQVSKGPVTFNGSLGQVISNASPGKNSNILIGSAALTWQARDDMLLSVEYQHTPLLAVARKYDNITGDLLFDGDVDHADMLTVSADYTAIGYGAYGSVGYTDSVNGIHRWNANSKVYVDIADGVNAYVRSKHTGDASKYDDVESFAPERYDRYLAGVGFRTAISDNVIVAGHVDGGRQRVDGVWNTGWTAQIGIESKPSKNWSMKVVVGTDRPEKEYKYDYVMGHVAYIF